MKDDKEKQKKESVKISTAFAVDKSIKHSKNQAKKQYDKPLSYTGHRTLYDDGKAKRQVKAIKFNTNKRVIDPYTGKELELRIIDAKKKYGSNWQEHLAEADHIIPLEKIHEEYSNRPWITNDDIKNVANSSDNFKVVSRRFNNMKRSKLNEQVVSDKRLQAKKGVIITEKAAQEAIGDSVRAKKIIKRKMGGREIVNSVKTTSQAGFKGALNAGCTTATMSGVLNIISVLKGEKDVEDAVKDVTVDTGKAMASGYVLSSGLTSISHTLSSSNSEFLKKLADSNAPAQLITTITLLGDTLSRYGKGEITTYECIDELGNKGVNLLTSGPAMLIGEMLIPIPILGATIGALIGTTITNCCYDEIKNILWKKEIEHQERLRIINDCNLIIGELRTLRTELEEYLNVYFKDYRQCFGSACSYMEYGFHFGDANSVIHGANQITRRLGGEIKYETYEEFVEYYQDGLSDEI